MKEIKHINKTIAENCAKEYRHYLAQYSATSVYGNVAAADRFKSILEDHGLTVEDVEDESDLYLKAIGK